jgi:hypothetical protein
MIYENIERGFLWRDWTNTAALDNVTVKGFVDMLNETFHTDSSTYTSLDSRLENINIWTAIKKGLLDEPTMDLIASQLNFPAWEYVGKFNLIAPFDTVLKRKREMLKHVIRLMKYRGTPYTVEQALLAFGFTNVIIHENINLVLKYDGTYRYNGIISYSGTLKHNLFSVELDTILDLLPPISATDDEQLKAIINIVNAFKKYRPELYQVIAHTPSVPAGDTRQIWNA